MGEMCSCCLTQGAVLKLIHLNFLIIFVFPVNKILSNGKQTKMLSKITLSLVFFIIMQSNVFAETPTISSIEELLRVTKSEQISKQTQ